LAALPTGLKNQLPSTLTANQWQLPLALSLTYNGKDNYQRPQNSIQQGRPPEATEAFPNNGLVRFDSCLLGTTRRRDRPFFASPPIPSPLLSGVPG
jgi:hypothetical protein